jgi:HAD domain in Swiss Army Knife RNA repair proteins
MEKINKVLFLDIDGCICLRPSRYLYFDPDCVKRLQNVLEITGAHIVISSAWRHSMTIEQLRDVFNKCGDRHNQYHGPIPYFDVSRIIDKTPCLDVDRSETSEGLWGRGYEIVTWLKKHQENLAIKKYIILDDETSDLQPLINFCVKTETEIGLTEERAQELIKKLGDS